VVSKTPTYRLLIETDSPWLAPVPHRGEKNKPSFIWHTAKVMSELIPNSSLEDIDRTTSANAKLCFNLGFDKNRRYYNLCYQQQALYKPHKQV